MTSIRGRLGWAALVTILTVTSACSGGGAAASASTPPGVAASIDAKDTKFSTAEFELPAGEASRLFFRNLDGAPHNVAIYRDSSAAQKIFVGETITDTAITYEVPALEAGEYFFRCDVHPEMTGTVTTGG
jgi:plastocyanin